MMPSGIPEFHVTPTLTTVESEQLWAELAFLLKRIEALEAEAGDDNE